MPATSLDRGRDLGGNATRSVEQWPCVCPPRTQRASASQPLREFGRQTGVVRAETEGAAGYNRKAAVSPVDLLKLYLYSYPMTAVYNPSMDVSMSINYCSNWRRVGGQATDSERAVTAQTWESART